MCWPWWGNGSNRGWFDKVCFNDGHRHGRFVARHVRTKQMNSSIFYGSALALVLGVVSAGFVGAGVAARTARPVGASA